MTRLRASAGANEQEPRPAPPTPLREAPRASAARRRDGVPPSPAAGESVSMNRLLHDASMIRFEDILDKVESYKPDFDEELLQKAYIFSAREHRGQVRSSGEPYLVHPLNVAYILADMRLDETSIAVGLLHDVLEDTLTTKEKLQETFGDDVAELVDGVTKISRYAYVSKEEQQAETFRKMLLAMTSDLRVVLVKLADRLHNMRTLQHLAEERRIAIAKETMEICRSATCIRASPRSCRAP
jgi:(p)ppGpp synthase/HD superfamily hydrolase